MNNHISLLLITKNEETNIRENLAWIKKVKTINEVIVVDDESTDQTVKAVNEIVPKKIKVKIFNHQLQNFSDQRNFGLSKTTNNWILWIDADEKVGFKMINFLNNFKFFDNQVFSFKRKDVFLGYKLKHTETNNQNFVRLFSKKYGHFSGAVHEIWQTNQSITQMSLNIYHFAHPTLKGFLQKLNRYSDLRAQELCSRGVKSNILSIIFYPLAKFIQNYIFFLGFLDSTPGIIFSLGMSFYSFLVRAKLWSLSQSSARS